MITKITKTILLELDNPSPLFILIGIENRGWTDDESLFI
jgi:hypothetical protein